MKGEQRWEIDSAKSSLCFSLRHIVLSEIRGGFGAWGGELISVPEDLSRSKVHVWVDAASIDTESPDRDAQLRSPEFLDVERFPRAEFWTTGITMQSEREAAVTGRLQLHGVTHPLALTVTAHRSWVDSAGSERADYDVRAKLDRQSFGLHWNQDLDVGGMVVGDKVELKAHVEIVRTGAVAATGDDGERTNARAW